MTQEQKAKLFDKAYKIAESIHRFSSNPAEIKRMEELFPTLKESEDEKIRKHLIKNKSKEDWNGVSVKSVLAWLEKQGEKSISFTFDDVLALQCCMETVKKVQEDKDLYEKLNDLHGRVYDAYQLEKQGKNNMGISEATKKKLEDNLNKALEKETPESWIEFLEKQGKRKQDPCEHCKDRCLNCYNFPCTEKIAFEQGKPVFEVSNGNDTIVQQMDFAPKSAIEAIKEEKVDNANKVDPKDYSSIDPNFGKSVDKVEPKFQKGDFIVTKYGRVNQVVAVDEDGDGYTLDNETYFSGSWINMYHLYTIQDAKDGDVLQLGEVTAIFKKYIGQEKCICYCSISRDGDFEIPIENGEDNIYGCTDTTPATKEQRDTLMKAMSDAGYTFDFEKKELKKIEQKPAWSEEDEPQKELAETYLTVFDKKFPILPTLRGKQLADYKNFLNKCQQIFGLKYWGIHPTQAKLFEKLSLLWATWGAEHLQGLGQTDCDVDNEISMWSEEDEERLSDAIFFVREYQIPTRDKRLLNAAKEAEKWLKSLKPKSHWKPSDEQMAALSDINVTGCISYAGQGQELINLFNDLKKLKEE